MEQSADTVKATDSTVEFWQQTLQEWKASGLLGSEFLRQRGLSKDGFYR